MYQWKVEKPRCNPRSPQIRAMKLMVSSGGARIFLRPGQGKTFAVLKAFDILRSKGMVDCLLVIAPLRVVTTSWPQQLNYWEDFDHLTHVLIHGGKEARRRAMESTADVYLMNLEGMIGTEWGPIDEHKGMVNPKTGKKYKPKLTPAAYACDWLRGRRVMLVVDESTKFKDPNTSRFLSLKLYLPFFNRRVILTGTPRPGKLENLFSQCYITDLGHDLGPFITHFRNRYMRRNENGFGYTELPGAAERVAQKIAPTTIQIETEEVVPTQVNHIWVPLPNDVLALYKELKKEFIALLGNSTVMAPNAGVLWGKLRQIAQGALIVDADQNWETLHEAKLDALENILEELDGEPAFCLYAYIHDYERINARLGYVVPRIGGGVSAPAGAAIARSFSGGGMPLLLGHPNSVAHGIDGLQQSCKNVIWFGNDPSWENTYQANLRVVRPGTKADQVNIYHIMADCGVERAILQKVTGKKEDEKNFLETLRNLLKQE